jgi:type I restriction enzyme R subunit
MPRDTAAYLRYFCARDSGNAEQLKENEPNRLALYTHVAAFVRAYANLANELKEAGFTPPEIEKLKAEVDHYEKVRTEVKLASGDYIDLKMYEPAMRHLIDAYIRAEESEKVSAFDDLSLIDLIVKRGAAALRALPKGIRENENAAAETIENNVRKLIIDEQPINPRYYGRMSQLLDALIAQRKQEALTYKAYLRKIVELTKKVKNPTAGEAYPRSMDTPARRALYDNLGKNEQLALALDKAIQDSKQDDWRGNPFKIKKVMLAIKRTLAEFSARGGAGDEQDQVKEGAAEYEQAARTASTDAILQLAKNQNEY